MAREYATLADLGDNPPDNAADLLARANRFLSSNLFTYCWYGPDEAGMPANPFVIEAFRDAVVAQVRWWDELGDSTGAAAAGWGNVAIGSVTLGRSVTAVAGADAPARQFAPEVWDCLGGPDLTPDVLSIGLVIT